MSFRRTSSELYSLFPPLQLPPTYTFHLDYFSILILWLFVLLYLDMSECMPVGSTDLERWLKSKLCWVQGIPTLWRKLMQLCELRWSLHYLSTAIKFDSKGHTPCERRTKCSIYGVSSLMLLGKEAYFGWFAVCWLIPNWCAAQHYQHIAKEHEIEEYTIGIMVTKRFLLGTR